jgi:membrane protein DedA with SNARE-associated domain
LFFLAYYFGEAVEKPFQAVGITLFVLLLSFLTFVMIRLIRKIVIKRKGDQELETRN